MLRLHFSSAPLTAVWSVPQTPEPTSKPHGLWYSCGNAWIDYLRSGSTWWGERRAATAVCVTVVKVDISRILRVRTRRDVRELSATYGEAVPDRDYPDDSFDFVDWARVAEKYAGVEFCPYFPSLKERFAWYGSFDVASGCVWDATAVQIQWSGPLSEALG